MKSSIYLNKFVIKGRKVGRLLSIWIGLLFFTFVLIAGLTNQRVASNFNSVIVKDVAKLVSSEDIYRLIAAENFNFQHVAPQHENLLTFSTVFRLATNIAVGDHRSLLGNELSGFMLFDSKILVAGEGTNYTNMPFESSPPDFAFENNDAKVVEPERKKETSDKRKASSLKTDGDAVYIYFTHSRESFLPQLPNTKDPNLAQHAKMNVMNVGDSLAENLRDFGIGTVVDRTDIIARLQKKNWKYGRSYDESRLVVQEAMAKNEELKYFIDVHRDSQRKKVTTVRYKGKDYARIAFVIGGDNPRYEENTALANALHDKLNKIVPGISRGVFSKSGAGVNGKYNQDLSDRAMLLEIGGVDNHMDELDRATAVFAEAFSEYFWKAEAVSGKEAK